MQFSISRSIEILERTPNTVSAMLSNISEDWALSNNGEETWSPFDVIGHLIESEKINFHWQLIPICFFIIRSMRRNR